MQEPRKLDEYSGWEIYSASPESFSVRKDGRRMGPYPSLERAREAIDAEETQNLSYPARS